MEKPELLLEIARLHRKLEKYEKALRRIALLHPYYSDPLNRAQIARLALED